MVEAEDFAGEGESQSGAFASGGGFGEAVEFFAEAREGVGRDSGAEVAVGPDEAIVGWAHVDVDAGVAWAVFDSVQEEVVESLSE